MQIARDPASLTLTQSFFLFFMCYCFQMESDEAAGVNMTCELFPGF